MASRAIVALPSFNLDASLLEAHREEIPALEERWLYLAFALRDPNTRVVFVSSLPVGRPTLEHYLSFLPDGARDRLTLIAVDDDSARPLSIKVLERPRIVRRIAATAGNGTGFLMPFNVGVAERELAAAIGLPLLGIDHRFAGYGTKSGGRRLFAEEGVAHPAGFEDVRSLRGIGEGIARLRAGRPDLAAVVAKHDDGVYGDGNAVVALGGLPGPGSPAERRAIDRRLRELPQQWATELARRGGIVEEMVAGEAIRSPSVQIRILPRRGPQLLSTHDQVLGGPLGQSFAGCHFPADPEYSRIIVRAARRVGERLAREGAIGRFAVDFVTARDAAGGWRAAAVEINLREGGTSHPYGALELLSGGRLLACGSRFVTAGGHDRAYYATDRLTAPHYCGMPADLLLRAATREGLIFDRTKGTGVVLHMLRTLETHGLVGATAIGRSRAEAEARYAALVELLDRLAGRQSVAA